TIGAKVNGKMVKISTPLQNGDIVEIIKSKKVIGPKQDWLEVVKTSLARSRIRHFLKKGQAKT
ncbi:MAG TPA: TGS domain-containing protein, partial [Patescibacteria group bacterium]|nr:TGS domain-containing protein [Patescibacteria group bacterium]